MPIALIDPVGDGSIEMDDDLTGLVAAIDTEGATEMARDAEIGANAEDAPGEVGRAEAMGGEGANLLPPVAIGEDVQRLEGRIEVEGIRVEVARGLLVAARRVVDG